MLICFFVFVMTLVEHFVGVSVCTRHPCTYLEEGRTTTLCHWQSNSITPRRCVTAVVVIVRHLPPVQSYRGNLLTVCFVFGFFCLPMMDRWHVTQA